MTIMNTHSFFSRISHPAIFRRISLSLAALALFSLTSCVGPQGSWQNAELAKTKAQIKANPDYVTSSNISGETPLHFAAMTGNALVADFLLANGADVNAKDNFGWTPLLEAANQGQKDMVLLLIARGADVNAADNNGETALKLAVGGNYTDVADLLRQHGAK